MAGAAFSQLHSPQSGYPVYTGRAPESRTTKALGLAGVRPEESGGGEDGAALSLRLWAQGSGR